MESENVIVRWSSPEDKNDIARLLRDLMVYIASLYGEEESSVKRLEHVLDDLDETFSRPGDYRFIVAEVDGKIAGICGAEMTYSTWHAKPYIILNDVFVDPLFRRRGIGTELLGFLTDYAHSIGCCRIDLLVESENWCARKLYEKHGFKCIPRASYSMEIQPSPGVP